MNPLVAIALLAASPANDAPHYGPAQAFSGRFSGGFEMSVFRGCFLIMTDAAYRRFQQFVPNAGDTLRSGAAFDIAILGRQTVPAESHRTFGHGYGHMGMAPCQIEATRVVSVRRVR